MKRYILTGGISSGKSTVVEMLKQHDIEVIDADKISFKIFHDNEDKIREIFETDLIDQELRKYVSKEVFSHPKMRFKLESFMLPLIKEEMKSQELKLNGKLYVLDIPLYFEKRQNVNESDFIILLNIPYKTQVERLMKRDNIDKVAADKKIMSQLPNSVKVKKSDYVIDNNSTLEDLKINVDKMIKEVFNL